VRSNTFACVDDELLTQLHTWVEKSGRALELRVARTLRTAGKASVQQSFTYLDEVTGLVRESDALARFRWTSLNDVPCDLTVAIECKSRNDKPWVAFYDRRIASSSNLHNWVVYAHGPFVGITEPLSDLWLGEAPFSDMQVATHVVEALTSDGRNRANDSVRQVLSCAASVKANYLKNQSPKGPALVLMAAVVTAAPLVTCTLDGSDKVVMTQVDHFQVWGNSADGRRARVFVLNEGALPQFASGLRDRAMAAGGAVDS
jgi:hypothetical protein